MAIALQFKIKESLPELKKILRAQPEHLRDRVRMLLVCKQSGQTLSKNFLANFIGVNHNTIQNWRRRYIEGGIRKLLQFKKGGYKPSLISSAAHKAIERKLKSPHSSFRSYKEIHGWIDSR